MRRPLLVLLLALVSCAGLAQSTFSIGLGDVATGTVPTMESTHAYLLDVPGGVERLTIEVDGGDQDADLAVYLGGEEVFYDASSAMSASYVVAEPIPGRYRIEVLNLLFQELSYTLTVSASSGTDRSTGRAASSSDRGEIALGDERTGVAPGSGSEQTHDLRIAVGSSAFTVRVDAGGRDVDLTVRFGGVEIFRDVSSNPYPVFHLPEPAAGTYRLSVASPLGRDVPYILTVEAPGRGRSTGAPPPTNDAPSDTPSDTPRAAPPAQAGPSGPAMPAWRHDFASGELLGWTVENGRLSNPGRGGPGGGGYLYADTPADRAVGYFVAPPDLLGDWTSLSSLEIVLRHGPEYEGSTFGPYEYDGVGDVLLMNGSMTATFAFAREVTRSWSSYEVPLNDGAGWRLDGGARSLADVLAGVTLFAVRAEYLVGHADAGLASVEAHGAGTFAGVDDGLGPYLRVAPTRARIGGELVVEFGGAPGNERDWIGLYAEGDGDREWLVWQYTEGARSGRLVFDVPAETGRYEARLFVDDGYERLARSGPFDVAR